MSFNDKLVEAIKLLATNRANPSILIQEIVQNGSLLGARIPDCTGCGASGADVARGHGVVLEEGEAICAVCGGSKGEHEIINSSPTEFVAEWVECETCKGEGKIKNA